MITVIEFKNFDFYEENFLKIIDAYSDKIKALGISSLQIDVVDESINDLVSSLTVCNSDRFKINGYKNLILIAELDFDDVPSFECLYFSQRYQRVRVSMSLEARDFIFERDAFIEVTTEQFKEIIERG